MRFYSSQSGLPHLSHHHCPLLLAQECGDSLSVFLGVGEGAAELGGHRMLCPYY